MPDLLSLAPVAPVERQCWLIHNLMPRAELVLLDGMSGVGKSLTTAMLATYFTLVRDEMGDKLVLVLSSHQQRELLLEFLANQRPDYDFLRGLEYRPEASEAVPAPSIAPHLLQFIEAAVQEHQPAVLLIDSLEELLQSGGETDSRQLIDFWTGLRTLAHTHDCSIVIPRKNGLHENRQYGPFTRIGTDLARFGLTIHWHPTDPCMRIVTIAKNQRGAVGEQTHLTINQEGIVAFTYTDAYEHVRPSRSPATWQPVPEHLVEEDKRIMELVEGLLMGNAMPTTELQSMVTRAGITKSAFERVMGKAKLKTISIDKKSCYAPSNNMLFRLHQREQEMQKTPENHARADAMENDPPQKHPHAPTRPKPLPDHRQAG